MKIGTFLETLAKKAGIDTTTPEFVAIKTSSESIEIDDTLATSFQTKLMTLEAAENNPTITEKLKKKFRAEALDGVDAQLKNILELGVLSETDVTEIKGIEGTYKKLEVLGQKVKGISESKGGKNADTEKLTSQINTLTEQLGKVKQEFADKEKSLLDSHEGELTMLSLKSLLQTKDYALPDEMPAERKVKIAIDALNEKIEANGLMIKRVNGNPTLLRKDGTKYYNEASIEVGLNDFTESVLFKDGILKVAGANPTTTIVKLPDGGGNTKPIDTAAAADMSEQAQNF